MSALSDFAAYLRACTDAQVLGVHAKESAAGRTDEALLAVLEAERRGLGLGLGIGPAQR